MTEENMVTSTNDLVNEKSYHNKRVGNKAPQYIAALSVCMGSLAAGMVLGWTANISGALQNGDLNDIAVDSDSLGWIGSFVNLGALLLCLVIGYICDLLGRKLAILLTIIPFMIGWLLIIFSTNIEMIYVGRFLTGLGGGALCVAAPLYTSEIAEKEIRGALGSYFQLLLTVGILSAYVLGSFLDVKVYTIICAIMPIVFGIVFMFQPETPFYSLKKNNDKAAQAALRKLRGNHYDVDAEIVEIKKILEADKEMKVSFTESFKKRATKISFVICFGLMMFQQLSGVNAVIFYTDTIFKSAGSSIASSEATIIVGVMQVAATFVSSLVIDKFGRRILLLGSALFMAISILALGVFFTLKDRDLTDADTINTISFLPIVSLCVFIIAFSLGFGPVPWMISSEVFPPEVKSVASSMAGAFDWLLAFIVTKFYLNLKNSLGGDVTFYIFCAISFLGTIFVFFIVPETKGKTLDEIQRELNGEKPSKNVVGIENQGFSS